MAESRDCNSNKRPMPSAGPAAPDGASLAVPGNGNDTGQKQVKVSVRLLEAGYCLQLERLTLRRGKWRTIRFPARFAHIIHPQIGHVLFDTGYSERFAALTRRLPGALYRWLTPVHLSPGESAAEQLQAAGVLPGHVGTVIISHFHADHLGGLRDLPNARFLHAAAGWESARGLQGLHAVRAGFLPGLLPADYGARSASVEQTGRPVELGDRLPSFAGRTGYDLVGDGSLVTVPLPGHAAGQIGLLLRDEQGDMLLCADAAWSSKAIREDIAPARIAAFIKHGWMPYLDTLQRLHRLWIERPDLRIVPTHCRAWSGSAEREDWG